MELSRKVERFCLEYAIDYNGAAAARRAGYAEKSAAKTACKLLKMPEVMHRVKELQAEQKERLCLSSDLVVIRTLELLDKCMANVPVLEWNYATHQMEESGQYQVDSKGAGKALELLAKFQGMLSGNNEQTDDGPVYITGEGDLPE